MPGADGRTQWQRVLDLLEKDPDSKRAVLSIYSGDELAVDDNPDVSCTIAAQLLLRDGHLHMSCYMRGNDAFMGLPSDLFSFTVLQELAAHELGARLGSYTHHVGSMHVNDANAVNVARLLAEVGKADYEPPAFRFPTMPGDDLIESIRLVTQAEKALRVGNMAQTPDLVEATGLH
ncbi:MULTISPECIES: thymidylate synthase [unclassified Nonomuraea]|uniref:thymidylate synthase n=1 Tax=unclassified Nonomuraea TaxID=2593643 RepID=UPI0033D3AC84